MKRLTFLLIFLCIASLAIADEVSLAWDPSTSTGVEGYKLYSRDYTHGYNTAIWTGTADLRTCTVTVPGDRETAFVLTAFGTITITDLDGNTTVEEAESGYSNEVVYRPTIVPPEPPSLNWAQKVIAAIVNFFDGLEA